MARIGSWFLIISLLCGFAFAQTPTKVRSVSSLPATCTGGSATRPTDEVVLIIAGVGADYICDSTNHWTLNGGVTSLSGLSGGTAPSSQTYDFATNADPVKVVTKALGTTTTDAASTQFVQTAINNAAFNKAGIFASTFGAVGEGHFQFNVSYTNGSNIITCSTCHFLTDATVGQAIWGTNLQTTGFSSGTTIVLPEGTVSQIDSDTQIRSSTNANSTIVSAGFLAWGTYEDTEFANAVTAAGNACTTLNLPALNPEGDGPAVIFLKTAQFIVDPPCDGSGGARTGFGISGYGTNASYLMPTPSFDATTCNGSSSQCFGVQGGVHRVVLNYSNFTIFGGGNSQPGAGFASKIGFLIGATDNSYAHDVQLLFWGASSTNGLGVGLALRGGEILTYNVGEDGFGKVGRKYISASNLGPIQEVMPVAYDNSLMNVYVNTTANNPVFTVGGNYGTAAQNGCVNNGGIWYSSSDQFGLPNGGSVTNAVLVGFCTDGGGTTTGNGTLYMANDAIYGTAMVNGSHVIFTNAAGDNIHLTNTFVDGVSGSGTTHLITNNGSFFDGGGNTFTQGALTTFGDGSGTYFGSGSIPITALVVGKIATTSGWGTSPSVSAASGNSVEGNFTITVGTTPGANPVATLTFPDPFLAAPTCEGVQIGGTQAQAFVQVGAPTTTTAAFTWVGTPTGGNTIQFHYHCWN